VLQTTPNWKELLVWRDGYDAWQKAGSLSEFAGLGPVPPPIPKPQVIQSGATVDNLAQPLPQVPQSERKPERKLIGGWLLLPMLGTVLAPFRALAQAAQDLAVFDQDVTPGVFAWAGSEMLFNVGMMVAWIVAAVRLFKRKRSYPHFFSTLLIISYLGIVVSTLVGVAFFNLPLTPEDYGQLTFGLVALLIWVSYMARSKRVRETFVW
jgi:hypothetical protein